MNIYIRYPQSGVWWARWSGPDPANPDRTKRYLRSTGTTDKRAAEKIMRQLASAADAGRWEALEQTKRARPRLLVGTIVDLYPAAAAGLRLEPKTVANNVRALFRILRAVKPDRDPRNVEVAELTADLVYQWNQHVIQSHAGAGEVELARACRGGNSNLRQARSVFSRHALTHYRRVAGLEIPDLSGFSAEPGHRRVEKHDYDKPDDLTLARTFQALPALRESDRNLFLAVWLALGYGLRASEIAAARADWFITRGGADFLRGDCLAKNRQIPDIRAQFGVWAQVKDLIDATQEYVLSGSMTERTDKVFRRAAQWMRGLGWRTDKSIHEFRAWAGCQVAEAEGLLAAQHWLRHASYAVTEKNYGRYIRAKAPELTLPSLTAANL